MKFYRGKKRIGFGMFKKYWGKHGIARIHWALSLKPGDYVATCEGCNRKIESIRLCWGNVGAWTSKSGKPNKHWFLRDVEFTDNRGRLHVLSGPGCVAEKDTPEQVTDYYKNWGKNLGMPETHWEKKLGKNPLYQAASNGKPIVDEFGEFLPEFEACQGS